MYDTFDCVFCHFFAKRELADLQFTVIQIFSYTMFVFTLSFENRNHFLTRNRLKVSVNAHVNDAINIIKFIGQQHAILTEISDQLNVCYTFHVRLSDHSFDSNF